MARGENKRGADMGLGIEPTGYCWKCGHPCGEGKLFCSEKHEQQHNRHADRQIKKSKKDGYGAAGSTR